MPWISTMRTPRANEEARLYDRLIKRFVQLLRGSAPFTDEANDLLIEMEVLATTTCDSTIEFKLKALLWEVNELHVDSTDWRHLKTLATVAKIEGSDEYLPDSWEQLNSRIW